MKRVLAFLAAASCAFAGTWIASPGKGSHATAGPSAPTFFGQANSGTEHSGGETLTITPPASMVSGDLVVVFSYQRGNAALTVTNAGGQTWTTETSFRDVATSISCHWATFNGTWSASPTFDSDLSANAFLSIMLVFRATGATWAVDVNETSSSYAAPGSPPDVTVPAVTTLTDNAIVLAAVASEDNDDWAVQTGGWTAEPTAGQKSGNGVDGSMVTVYKIQTPAGSTGTVAIRQMNVGPDAGAYFTIAFKP